MVRKILLTAILALLCISAAGAPRYERSINDGWSFHKDRDINVETVSLPHTWNAQDAADDEPGYYRGVGWYEKAVYIDDDLTGKQVFVRFGGANQVLDLYVNGSHAGQHKGGYTSFVFDISDCVRAGGNNFRIKLDSSHDENIPPIGADFTFFGGIYRGVSLVFVPENHISVEHLGGPGVYITTPEVSSAKATVHIRTHLGISRPVKTLYLEHRLLDPSGRQVAQVRSTLRKPSSGEVVDADAEVICPQLWDVDTPRLYTVVTRLLDRKGQEIDVCRNTFGIRTFRFDPDKGFFLNGRHLKLIGTNRHQDYPGMGNAIPDEMHLRDVRLLKEMGGNFLRISHYPQDPLVAAECDRLGILACVEIPVVNRIGSGADFTTNSMHMAREMVYQNFNHPCMIAWAYMNEVLLDGSPWKEGKTPKDEYLAAVRDCARHIDDALHEADSSRPTMIPCDGDRHKYIEGGICEIPDIVGFNIYYGWYYSSLAKVSSAVDKLHAAFPTKPLIITEYGADSDPRLHSYEPECHDYTCEYALLFHKNYLPVIMEKEYLCGASLWTIADFHSEGRGFAVPHFNCKGITSVDRTPKDSYWWYSATLRKSPFIRIGGSDWKIRGGQELGGSCIQPVEVFATAYDVELSLNGKSLGVKTVHDGSAVFEVPFRAGENVLEARGSDGAVDLQRVDFRMVPQDMSAFKEISVLLGTRRYFEDRDGGVIWIPEQEYRPGSWGYVGGQRMYQKTSDGQRPAFEADIAGTDLDPIFQTQRAGIEAFRADVPDGSYYIDLYFADLTGPFRGKPMLFALGNDAIAPEQTDRVFSVSLNGTTVIKNLNIAQQYGFNAAVVQRISVDVEGGKGIKVDFLPVEGLPVLNAIRILRVR